MEKIKEIKIPKGVESISVTQHDDKVVIEFMPKKAELKKGDLAIFWDDVKAYALIRIYDRGCHEYHCDSYGTGWRNATKSEYHYDSYGTGWRNAIKFKSKEQFEKVLRGEI